MKKILISGDSIVDHHIYKGNQDYPSSSNNGGTQVVSTQGGASLLSDLIRSIAPHKNHAEVFLQNNVPQLLNLFHLKKHNFFLLILVLILHNYLLFHYGQL